MKEFVFDLSLILVGAGVLSSIAVLVKQPIIIAYIVCGILVGPWGAGWIEDVDFVENISHLGITLLLFLAGLSLHPQKLFRLFKDTAVVTFLNCVASFSLAFGFSYFYRFTVMESFCIGLAMMFSSTILTIKLLPTTRLHHEKMGAICIGVLILQDLLAVAVLAFIRCLNSPDGAIISFTYLSLKLVVFIGILVLIETFVLRRVMRYVNRLHEVLFVLGLAWCFGVASVSNKMGLFFETGAFFAGVVLARHPIALFIGEKLKPLRDFFLVLFFFSLGANLNLNTLMTILLPVLFLSVTFVLMKPLIFKKYLVWQGERPSFAEETGVRLGQLSEFSLLVALLAFQSGHISDMAAQFIQLVTIMTFIISSYIVVFRYPTPIGVSKNLIKD